MAIGDVFSVFLGTAATNRQPSSGVEEQLTAIVKNGNTDSPLVYDGSDNRQILDGSVNTHTASAVGTTASNRQMYNMAIQFNNALYIRKGGSTDKMYFSGLQVNA